jgi:hypothetical protein
MTEPTKIYQLDGLTAADIEHVSKAVENLTAAAHRSMESGASALTFQAQALAGVLMKVIDTSIDEVEVEDAADG